MFKDVNKLRPLVIQIILLIFFTILVSIYAIHTHNMYKQEIIRNNASIIGLIIEKYPNIEIQAIKEIISDDSNIEQGIKALGKYGIDDIENLDEISNINKLKNKMVLGNIIFVVSVITIYVLINLYFYKKEDKRLNDISNYINNILNNDYSLDIREYDEDSISTLKNYIYKVTIKLRNMSEYSQKEKEYLEVALSDISHQLKTPLTSIMVMNELLENKNLEESKRKECQQKSKQQLEKIQWLITSLLKISQIDSGTIKLKKENVNAKELINKTQEPLIIQIEAKSITLVKDIEENLEIICDENWTVEALINIIKNAYEHTEKDGTIKITVQGNPIYNEIKIEDNGSGIREEDINHIFERFYKGKSNKESIGIGLNMSKTIIEKQNGTIEVQSTEGVGTCFTIKMFKF